MHKSGTKVEITFEYFWYIYVLQMKKKIKCGCGAFFYRIPELTWVPMSR